MFKLIIFIIVTISFGDCSVYWLTWQTGQYSLPANAVKGGHYGDITYYVIRAYYNGGLLPGKYSPSESFASVPYGGTEIFVRDIQVRIFFLFKYKT